MYVLMFLNHARQTLASYASENVFQTCKSRRVYDCSSDEDRISVGRQLWQLSSSAEHGPVLATPSDTQTLQKRSSVVDTETPKMRSVVSKARLLKDYS